MSNIRDYKIVKWAGGKEKDLPTLTKYFPGELFDASKDITFIDSCAGGGAIFINALLNMPGVKRLLINDLNRDLMNAYWITKYYPADLINTLDQIQKQYNSLSNSSEGVDFYNMVRSRYNLECQSQLERVRDFIFLNKTCHSGLFREDGFGYFNVPVNKKDGWPKKIFERDNILRLSSILNSSSVEVKLYSCDFARLSDFITGQNTFIYVDPPYRDTFNKYTRAGFDDDTQKRLKRTLDSWTSKYGCLIMESNSYNQDDDFLGKLYKVNKPGGTYNRVICMSYKGIGNSVKECIIKNY